MGEVFSILSWYLVITLVGISALPLAFRFFNRLPGRGVTLARPLGLLIWAFVFWLLNSLGILQNDLGGQIAAFIVLLVFSILATRGGKFHELLAWLKTSRQTIRVGELLFLLLFIGWAWIRGMNPEAAYTEKPMELAFINSILRSPVFPPQDPWLSGYAISYYYFGYVMIAMLARITVVSASVAFNLTSALWFAMTAAALYGVVYDITSIWGRREGLPEGFSRRAGLLGPLFVLIISTVEGVLEFLHSGGVFWKDAGNGTLTSRFWTWLGILDLNVPPPTPFDWIPSRASGWLWWRGSRVIQDMTLSGANVEVIDEFPFFSYLLSDLHPHLLAVPFTLIAVAVALNLFAGARLFINNEDNRITAWLKNWTFWLTALILGSLGFINTWDFPIYVGLFCLVWAFMRYQSEGWKISILWNFLKNGLALGVAGFVLYLPFYLGFDSQAGGILPSLEFMTRGVHFWVLFAALLIPIFAFVIVCFTDSYYRKSFMAGLKIVSILLIGLFVLSMLYGGLLLSLQQIGPQFTASTNGTIAALGVKLTQAGDALAGVHGNFPAGDILLQGLLRRIKAPGTWLTLGFLLTLILAVLIRRDQQLANVNDATDEFSSPEEKTGSIKKAIRIESFVLILTLMGVLLTLFPEYLYLRDQFGTRMNTIFKFYYQAWILWGIAAAAGSAILFHKLRGWRMIVFQVLWVLTVFAGLTYPAVMLWNKTGQFSMKEWTLDGNAYFQRYYPGDYAAITWLQQAPLGVVVEAVGGSYTDFARVSTRSGQPTVLGWPGHESQWRGGGEEMGSRYADVQLIYESGDWTETSRLLDGYNIRYVVVGNLERTTYKVNEEKLNQMLTAVYRNEEVTIYEVATNSGAFQQ